jgi:hypothetical protein
MRKASIALLAIALFFGAAFGQGGPSDSAMAVIKTPGSLVKVNDAIENPRFGWGSVQSGDIGVVAGFDGEDFIVDFPSHDHWYAEPSELVPALEKSSAVVPGPDWPEAPYSGKPGTVISGPDNNRAVKVRWPTGKEGLYAFGAAGRYEVFGIDPTRYGASTASKGPFETGAYYKYGTWRVYNDGHSIYIASEDWQSANNTVVRLPLTSNGWFWVSNMKGMYVVWSQGDSENQIFSLDSIPKEAPKSDLGKQSWIAGNWSFWVDGSRLYAQHRDSGQLLGFWEGSNGWWELTPKGASLVTQYSSSQPNAKPSAAPTPAPSPSSGASFELYGSWYIAQTSDALYVVSQDWASAKNTAFRFPSSSNGWFWMKNMAGSFVVWTQGTSDPQSFGTSDVPSGKPSAKLSKTKWSVGNWNCEVSGDYLYIRHKDAGTETKIWSGSNGWWEYTPKGGKIRTIYSSDKP